MKITAILKGYKDQLGRSRVYIRISDRGKRKFIPTQIKISPKDWDGKVKSSHPQHRELNRVITEAILGAETPVKEIYFSDYAERCMTEWERVKQPGTLRHIRSKLKKFTGWKDLRLSQINPNILTKYRQYCFDSGLSSNTVWDCLKSIRIFIMKAHREGMIKENPFLIFQMPVYRNPQKIFLTKEQIGKIDKFSLDKKCPKEYRIAATWFVIGCYTGLRYSDQFNFNRNKIKDGRLIIYTAKTGQPVSLKMNKKLSELFERINYQPIPFTNEHYNRLLKAIGSICKIKEKLTVHVSRHTAAVLLASAGVSIEVTAKILGHNSIRTTSIYYQITGQRIDSEFEKIF